MTPTTPPASIKSPNLNGRKIIIITPAAKFCNEFCKAKPTAKPAAPISAINEVVSKPNWFSAATKINSNNRALAIALKKLIKISSIPDLSIILANNSTVHLTTIRPRKIIASAITTFIIGDITVTLSVMLIFNYSVLLN